jgi:hypothetical protein
MESLKMAVKQIKNLDLTKILGSTKKDLEAQNYITQDELKRIGNVVIERIRERTQSGIGVDEAGREVDLSTRPYSIGYAKKKGVSVTDVDLTNTGNMLENMFVKNADSNSIEISVRNRDYGKLRGAEEGIKKRTLGGGIKVVKRPFFNVSKNDLEIIRQDRNVKRILDNAAERLIREKSKKLRGI